MPGKNIEKNYASDTYYHVYNRGVNKRKIFLDDHDYRVFLNLLKRYFGAEPMYDSKKREYPNFSDDVELAAYCLMPNHYHLLIYVKGEPETLAKVMSSVITAYAMHFNKKHKRIGSLFGKPYRAVAITEEPQLQHITRYIHLNPVDLKVDYRRYEYSSIGYYIRQKSSDWVTHGEILGMFDDSKKQYRDFLDDYLDRRAELKEIYNELY